MFNQTQILTLTITLVTRQTESQANSVNKAHFISACKNNSYNVYQMLYILTEVYFKLEEVLVSVHSWKIMDRYSDFLLYVKFITGFTEKKKKKKKKKKNEKESA